mmetsp:Transcript_42754/g.129929  ORF Transcript_42754/g.129929 Transcript_42754/m.129929 type:complete len:1873 (-) Transcript_42754:491-6109(-)
MAGSENERMQNSLRNSLPSFPVSTIDLTGKQRPGLTRVGDSVSTIGFQSAYMIAQENMHRDYEEQLNQMERERQQQGPQNNDGPHPLLGQGQGCDHDQQTRAHQNDDARRLSSYSQDQQAGSHEDSPRHMNTSHPLSREQQLNSQTLRRQKFYQEQLRRNADNAEVLSSTSIQYEARIELLRRMGVDGVHDNSNGELRNDAALRADPPHAHLSDIMENGASLETPRDPGGRKQLRPLVHPSSAPAAMRETVGSPQRTKDPPASPTKSERFFALKPTTCGKPTRWAAGNSSTHDMTSRARLVAAGQSSMSDGSRVERSSPEWVMREALDTKPKARMPDLPDIGASKEEGLPAGVRNSSAQEDADLAAALEASMSDLAPKKMTPPREAPKLKPPAPKVRMKELWPGGPIVPVEEDGFGSNEQEEQSPDGRPLSRDEAGSVSSSSALSSGQPLSARAPAAATILAQSLSLPHEPIESRQNAPISFDMTSAYGGKDASPLQSQPEPSTPSVMLMGAMPEGEAFPPQLPRFRDPTDAEPPLPPADAPINVGLVSHESKHEVPSWMGPEETVEQLPETEQKSGSELESTREQETELDSEPESELQDRVVTDLGSFSQGADTPSVSSEKTPIPPPSVAVAMVEEIPMGVKDPPPQALRMTSKPPQQQQVSDLGADVLPSACKSLHSILTTTTLSEEESLEPPELPVLTQEVLSSESAWSDAPERREEASIGMAADDFSARSATDEYRDILDRVQGHRGSAAVIAASCHDLRLGLVRLALRERESEANSGSEAQPGSAALALPRSWAETLADAASVDDLAIRTDVLRTMWTLAALDDRLKSDVQSSGGVGAAVSSMGQYATDGAIKLYGAGLLGCLAGGSDLHAGAVLRTEGSIGRLTEAAGFMGLKEVGATDASVVSEVAFRALFHLFLLHFREQGHSGAQQFVSEMVDSDGNAEDMIMRAMQRHDSSSNAQTWACKLLAAIVAVDNVADIQCQDKKPEEEIKGAASSVSTMNRILEPSVDLVGFASSSAAAPNQETSLVLIYLELLSQLSMVPLISRSSEMTRSVAQGTIQAMHTHSFAAEAQVLGCTIISNLCCCRSQYQIETEGTNEPDTARSSGAAVICQLDGARCLVHLLKDHASNLDVVSCACMALACLCASDQRSKQLCIDADVIRSVVKVYRSQVGSMKEKARGVRENASLVLSSLSASPDQLNTLNNCGVMVDLIKSSVQDGKSYPSNGIDFAVPPAVLNLLASNCLAGDVSAKSATTSTIVKFVLKNNRCAEEAEQALLMLQSLTSSADCANLILMSSGALDHIIRTMDSSKDNSIIQENGCRILSNIFVNGDYRHLSSISSNTDDGNHGSDGPSKFIQVIIDALHSHPSHEGIQEMALLALRNFCVSMPRPVVASNSVLPILVTVLDDTLFSVERNAHNLAIRQNCTGFLWALARVSDDVCQTLSCSDAVNLITESLQQYPHDEIMQQEAIGAMATVARVPDTHAIFGSELAVHSIISCMDRFGDRQDIVENGCSLLAALTNDSFQVKMNIVENDFSITQIIGCMYRYPDSPVIICEACTALAHLAMDAYLKVQIASEGGIERIQYALDVHRQDPSVMKKACGALANLISGTETDILRGNDVAKKVIAVSETYISDVELQEKCLTALWNLAVKDDQLKEDIVRSHGIAAVVHAMKLNLSSMQVQEKGCVTLWSLAVLDAAQAEIGRVGGIDAIINGALAHVTCTQLQTEVIGVLRSLATNVDNKETIRNRGGVQTIASIMFVHYNNSAIQESACSALSNIAVNPVTNKVAHIVGNELDAVVSAMSSFPLVENVQKQACVLLRNYTFESSNIEAMKSNIMLLNLLQMASESFPTACAERGSYILSRLLH